MANNELNDAAILDQMREHWQKLLMLVLWKTQGMDKAIRITSADIQAFADVEGITLFTHGHHDGFSLSLVTPEKAASLAEYDKKMRGSA